MKNAQIVFAGITFNDTIGFGQDVNQTYSIGVSPHHAGGCEYQQFSVVNGVNVQVTLIITSAGTEVRYYLTPTSDLTNTVKVFEADAPDTQTVITNSLAGGGTATITLS